MTPIDCAVTAYLVIGGSMAIMLWWACHRVIYTSNKWDERLNLGSIIGALICGACWPIVAWEVCRKATSNTVAKTIHANLVHIIEEKDERIAAHKEYIEELEAKIDELRSGDDE